MPLTVKNMVNLYNFWSENKILQSFKSLNMSIFDFSQSVATLNDLKVN